MQFKTLYFNGDAIKLIKDSANVENAAKIAL